MVVHSSILNPYFSPFFGTLALATGQLFPERWFPLTSNVGLLVFCITLLLLMCEVDKDMVAADDFAGFLTQVAAVGDKITVKHISQEGQPNKIKLSSGANGEDDSARQHDVEGARLALDGLQNIGQHTNQRFTEEEKREEVQLG